MDNKTHGVLTDAEIKSVRYAAWDFAAWEAGSLQFRLQFARAIEAAVLAKAAPQSPVAPAKPRCSYCDGTGDVHTPDGEWRGACPECKPVAPADERAFPGAPLCSVCSTLIGSAPTVSTAVPDGCILIQESDAVPFVHPEYGAGVFFTDDCKLNTAPTPPTSAADAFKQAEITERGDFHLTLRFPSCRLASVAAAAIAASKKETT